MKTTLRSWLGTGLLFAAVLITAPLSASTLLFQEHFDGSNYTVGETIPRNPNSPWMFYTGADPAPLPLVKAIEADSNLRAPTSGNMIHGIRQSGQGSFSGVYFSTEKLLDGGSYEWNLKYKTGGGNTYIYLDTNAGQTFAGFNINGTSLFYYSAKGGGVGTYTQAGPAGNRVSVASDIWYDIRVTLDVRAEGSDLLLDTTFSFTQLGESTPLFQVTMADVTTNATLLNNIRMGVSPQNVADFMLAEVAFAAIPEPGSVALFSAAGLFLGATALRRKSRR